MRCAASIGVALTCAALATAAAAQQEIRASAHAYRLPPTLIIAQVTEVPTEVVVRDAKGQPVAGLMRSDFQLFDNGQPRPLTAFAVRAGPPPPPTPYSASHAAPAPRPAVASAPLRSVALFFDDVNTAQPDLTHARDAAQRFVREAMGPNDHVAVFTASGVNQVNFTRDATALLAAIARIRAHPRQSDSQFACPRITPYQAYLIAVQHDPMALNAAIAENNACPENGVVDDFTGKPVANLSLSQQNANEVILAQAESTWDAAEGVSLSTVAPLRGALRLLARQPGNRMLLMASGGFLTGGILLEQQQDAIIQQALHADITINALEARGLFTDAPGRPLNEATDVGTLPLVTFIFEESAKFPMRQEQDAIMSRMAAATGGLFFHDNSDLTLGFDQLGLMPSVSYAIAFSPGDIPHNGKYHKLKIELTPKSKDILQYRPGYFAPPPVPAGLTPQRQMDSAMRATDTENGLPATVGARPGAGAVNVEFHLDARHLPFASSHGRHTLDLIFIAGLF
ncbi:MAG: VWA domain-containing protein, partial [Terriglobales bacterium]